MALSLLQIYEPELGVLTQLYAGTSPECAEMNGKVGFSQTSPQVQVDRFLFTYSISRPGAAKEG